MSPYSSRVLKYRNLPCANLHRIDEIQSRIRRRYLDRLSVRAKKMRRLLIEREWEELRKEFEHLAATGETFGFQDLTFQALEIYSQLPSGRIPKAATPLKAKESIESLLTAVDTLLLEHNLNVK